MSFLAVGDDGLVLWLGPSGSLHHQELASQLNVNGVARTRLMETIHVKGGLASLDNESFVAVCDDGEICHREIPYPDSFYQGISKDWVCTRVVVDVNLNAIAFARGSPTGFAAGDDGHVALTLDANRWESLSRPTGRHLRAVCAVDKHTVWVAGDEGAVHMSSNVIYKGWDGFAYYTVINLEMKWTPMPTGVTKHLRGIAVGHGMVIAVGDDGMVVYHRSGKWGHTQITGKNLRAVAMSPGGKVIAVGDDGWIGIRKLAGTGSEASHWTDYTNVTSKHLRGVTAHDDDHWAIVGDATFLSSDDGGGHWHQHANDGTLNAVC